MSEERVIVRQNSDFETEFLAADPRGPESGEPAPVKHLQELTPYGMLLAGLGACTAIVLHAYARRHGVALREVETVLEYHRVFDRDCRDCEDIAEYREEVTMQIGLRGDLGEEERRKLFKVSRYCPVEKMLERGVTVRSRLAPEG